MIEYKCPHCGHAIEELVRIERIGIPTEMLRRHHRNSPEFLERVIAVHAQGGMPAVIGEWGVTERTARRWLAGARANGD